MAEMIPWIAFNAFVLAMLALDLGVFHRRAHVISSKEAGVWSATWIGLALLFNLGVAHFLGPQAGLEFLTGYLIEKALSIDNIFVMVVLFSYFSVPAKYQHRVLFWGVLGALVMRGAMIAAGVYLIERFHSIIYVFGSFLVLTGARMAFQGERQMEPEANPFVRLVRRIIPVSHDYAGQKLFVYAPVSPGGPLRRMATPLFLVLVLVETTDIIFAVDSIPAIFAVTTDPFLIYTSNVFAILGLRSLYFLLANVVTRFHYLKLGLAVILVFVGGKMLVSGVYELPVLVSLLVIATVLAVAIGASLLFPRRAEARTPVEVGAGHG